ncbi:MAG: 16S rRNA (guanine(527)-N(7))-methyltransferase RsmG [Nocardioides sp.]|uniref:16S rRNA (guanine(527)-N(7))-methyltransferase RsmG n=1 Tax=Nocardioides sp. TaxID=35761 RepID=UPI0039E29B3E
MLAARVFGDRLPLIEAYADRLTSDGVVRGLVGPREVPRLWERHLLNSVGVAELVPPDASLCDVGSGAGLPGLVLAIARPDLSVTLVEPLLRRTTFLTEVVDDLGLDRVEVIRGRADALHGQRAFDIVTARAVAPLARLVEWCMPLVRSTGALVALKGASAEAEIGGAKPVLEQLGCAVPELISVGEGLGEASSRAVRVEWAGPSAVGLRLVRRNDAGVPRKVARRRKQGR